jgi:hypothetical protein
MTVAMTATGGFYGVVVLGGLLAGLWLRGWVERRARKPLSTEPMATPPSSAMVGGP